MAQRSSQDSRYDHLDGRVSVLAEDMAAVKSSMGNITVTLKSISDKVNTPPSQVNFFALVTSVIAICGVLAGYVDGRMSPLERQDVRVETRQSVYREILRDHSEAINKGENNIVHLQNDIEDAVETTKELDARVRATEIAAAEAKASRKAIGD